jgi:Pentapeptide repeats (8 copies)
LKVVETNALLRLDISNCPHLDEASILKRLFKNILRMKVSELKYVFDPARQRPTWLTLAEIVKEDSSFKEQLFSKIQLSKSDPHMAMIAANAISILNLAKISFSGRDFRGIRIPGACLGEAILANVDLREADLQGANLSKAVLSGALLDGAFLSQVQLRQGLAIHCLSVPTALFSHPHENRLIEGCYHGSIQIRDVTTGRELKQFVGAYKWGNLTCTLKRWKNSRLWK